VDVDAYLAAHQAEWDRLGQLLATERIVTLATGGFLIGFAVALGGREPLARTTADGLGALRHRTW
jgi:hypothetical protein